MNSLSPLLQLNQPSPTLESLFENEVILQRFEKKILQPKQFIYRPNQFCNNIFFVRKGRVKIGHCSCNGEFVTNRIIYEGDIFGELALAGVNRKLYFSQSVGKVELLFIDAIQLKSIISVSSELRAFVIKKMSERIISAEQKIDSKNSKKFKNSRNRIINYICNLAEKRGQQVGYEILINGAIPHRDIGSMTFTSRQTVTTTLNELRNKNLLTYNRKRLLIRDLELLKLELKPSK